MGLRISLVDKTRKSLREKTGALFYEFVSKQEIKTLLPENTIRTESHQGGIYMGIQTVKVVTATTDEQYQQLLDIRKIVFVQEQNVPEELEIDEYDIPPHTSSPMMNKATQWQQGASVNTVKELAKCNASPC